MLRGAGAGSGGYRVSAVNGERKEVRAHHFLDQHQLITATTNITGSEDKQRHETGERVVKRLHHFTEFDVDCVHTLHAFQLIVQHLIRRGEK